MHGILPLDKPRGLTSHDVVNIVRRLTRQRSVGHAGTLDPLATGVLVVCLGDATRLSEQLMATRKWYMARVLFGYGTETDDIDGTEVHAVANNPAVGAIRQALAALVGPHLQTPPTYSAIKQSGVPAYARARRDQALILQPRAVTIGVIALLRVGVHAFAFRHQPHQSVHAMFCDLLLECSAGTYVRAVARDLGAALDTAACIAGLRRLASGQFTVREAVPLAALQDDPAGVLARSVRPPDAAVPALPAVVLASDACRRVAAGAQIELPTSSTAASVRVYDGAGVLLALGDVTPQAVDEVQHDHHLRLQPRRVFPGREPA
jgi:tRNA pseudouridine55 synthase